MASLDKFKITAVVWDSDKNPDLFTKWQTQFSNLVKTMHWGNALEMFLDAKLDRIFSVYASTPSYPTLTSSSS